MNVTQLVEALEQTTLDHYDVDNLPVMLNMGLEGWMVVSDVKYDDDRVLLRLEAV
jgi:hypothetical protein